MTAFSWDDETEFFDADWAETIQIAGTNYSAIRYDRSYSRSVSESGLDSSVKMSYMLKASDFSTIPYRGQQVVISSVTYRVQTAKLDSTGKTITIDLTENYG